MFFTFCFVFLSMNWNYISGFFDADGSVSITKNRKNEQASIQLSFHNNELKILEEIKHFISADLSVKGTVIRERARKESHSDAYELRYVYQAGYKVAKHLQSHHPKKAYRLQLANEIAALTPRNGKYSKLMLEKRNKCIEDFFNATPRSSTKKDKT